MESTTTSRTGALRRRLLRAALVGAALAVGGLSAAAPAAALPGVAPAAGVQPATGLSVPAGKNFTGVQFDDTADGGGVLNQAKVKAALEKIDFNEPTKVAIYTRDGLYSDQINTETLKRAKAKHPDWISASDSDKWADGLLIITLSIEQDGHGQIGTYFGEDRKLDDNPDRALELEYAVQQAGTPQFRAGDWTAGVIKVAEAAAGKMNQPWYTKPQFLWPTGIAAAGVGVGAGAVALTRANNRTRFGEAMKAGTSSLTTVTMDLDNTELSARALPKTGSTIAADLEGRFQSFMSSYRSLVTEQDQLGAMGKKEQSRGEVRQRAERFRDGSRELDAVDDTITAAAALYARTATWQDAWRLQVAPLEQDLAGVPGILSEAGDMRFGFFGGSANRATMEGASAALSSWLSGAQQRLQDLNAEMLGGSLDTDAALERLKELRAELSDRLQDFSRTQIEVFSKSESERSSMEEQMNESMTQRRWRGSILDVVVPRVFWSSSGYSRGYSAGVQRVERARSAASSSSGSTRGYGGGGGSFSGAGSSSRF